MAAMSDYLENKLLDQLFRGQAYTFPATLYFGLLTATPSDTGGGTEVTGGNYSRASLAATLANFAGTQGAGTTVASTGTGGTTSNNAVVSFPAPNADWGRVTHFGVYDASTAGNLLFWGALTAAKNVNNGDSAPSFAAAAFSFQIDN